MQGLLFVLLAGTGVWKLVTPVAELAAKFPWMGEVPLGFLRMTAVFDLLGGLGVLLPSLTRVAPRLTVLAALGCAALQACAVVFHVSRGEAANTPFNFLLVALSLFVLWGRRSKAPIPPRQG
ncbi:MAG TPA: DoxX family protein [Polyangiaceae bacterium]|nr:DoxX family protein [Polyangiaceae bacterium]